MKIFLVDDSMQVVERLKAMLALLPGIEVIGSATDLPEALHSIRTARPDVVLLDLRLPSGSGMQVLQMIKNEKLGTIVVVLTNYAFPQYRKRCEEAGAYAFLDKSRDFTAVPQVLRALADLHNQARGPFPPQDLTSPTEPKVRVGSR
jgi:DNA-binding NarL/FixJ family response regulator